MNGRVNVHRIGNELAFTGALLLWATHIPKGRAATKCQEEWYYCFTEKAIAEYEVGGGGKTMETRPHAEVLFFQGWVSYVESQGVFSIFGRWYLVGAS